MRQQQSKSIIFLNLTQPIPLLFLNILVQISICHNFPTYLPLYVKNSAALELHPSTGRSVMMVDLELMVFGRQIPNRHLEGTEIVRQKSRQAYISSQNGHDL